MTQAEGRGEDPVLVVTASVSRLGPWAAAHERWLSQAEVARAGRHRFASDRTRFVVSRLVTRAVLGRYLGVTPGRVAFDDWCRRCSRPHAKPAVAGAPRGFDFSASRSGDLVVVALTDAGPVGADVEHVDRALAVEAVAGAVLTETEQAALAARAGDRLTGFLRAWTRKEAYAKATGLGLVLPLRDLTTAGEGPEALVARTGVAGTAGRVRDLEPRPGYVAAVARVGAFVTSIPVEERAFAG